MIRHLKTQLFRGALGTLVGFVVFATILHASSTLSRTRSAQQLSALPAGFTFADICGQSDKTADGTPACPTCILSDAAVFGAICTGPLSAPGALLSIGAWPQPTALFALSGQRPHPIRGPPNSLI